MIKTGLILLLFAVHECLCGDPEVHYNASQLITSKHYPAELHHVTTRDGYILGLHRIPYGKNDKPPTGNETRPVFFLQHGLLCSSTNWLTNLENESLAYILADNGFDVWMGNVRGNTYSRAHTKWSTDSRQFWEFSFDEHAQIDLPAMIDYVLSVSKQDKIFYAGHSQGTMMGFSGFTFNKTLASHINKFYALAPVATVKHIKGLFAYVAKYYKEIAPVFELGDGEFFSDNEAFVQLAKVFCHSSIDELCANALFVICGFNEKNINASRMPVYLNHTPAATSIQNVIHWAQMVKSGNFQMYDYGSIKDNMDHYHQKTPPLYSLDGLSVPTYLFTGSNDYLADPEDVAHLVEIIKPVLGDKLQQLNLANYEHLDFIWGLDANTKVYSKMVDDAKMFMQ